MKKLVLDDDKSRMAKFFLAKKQGEELRQVWGAEECIQDLKSEEWDLVSLDHDLRGQPYDDPTEENSGSEVVRWIVANKPKVKEFVVHSYNFKAAPSMVKALQEAGYKAEWIPFNL